MCEKKEAMLAREIVTLLLVEGTGTSYQETGWFLGRMTGSGVRQHRERAKKRLLVNEDFAHTFAIAEHRSNIAL